jgi:hypothetical protein
MLEPSGTQLGRERRRSARVSKPVVAERSAALVVHGFR